MSHYVIVIEREANGAFSASVPGLPVYAAADSLADAESAITATLQAYIEAYGTAEPNVTVRVATVTQAPAKIRLGGVGALLGGRRSAAKAKAARANGRLGGRPRKTRARRPVRSASRAE